MASERAKVFIGVVLATMFWVAWIYIGLNILPESATASAAVDRLSYTITWEALIGLTLLLGIAANATQRFFSDDLIDGSSPSAGSFQEINARYLSNTQEQALLAFIGHLALCLVVPVSALHIIPVLVALFIFARLCFWIGYHISPSARSFGFATTFHPTVAVYAYLIWMMIK